MCNLTHCIRCQKFSWIGCGKHLKETFEKVKIEDLCKCDIEKYKKAYIHAIPKKSKS